MTGAQAAAVASIERERGKASRVPLGPRRDRALRFAGYGAVVVQDGEWWEGPNLYVVEEDGRVEEVAAALP